MDELLGQGLAKLVLPMAVNKSPQRDFNLDPGLRRDDAQGLDADLRRDDEHGLDADLRWDDEHGLDADLRWDDGQGLDAGLRRDDEQGLDTGLRLDDEQGLDPGLRRDDEQGLDADQGRGDELNGVPTGVGTPCKATCLRLGFDVTHASDQARMKKPRGKAARFGVLREVRWISGRTAAC